MNATTITFITILLWIVCGVIQWGLMYAYWIRKYPEIYEARTSSIVIAFAGPIGLFIAISCLWKFNGFKKKHLCMDLNYSNLTVTRQHYAT